LQPVPELEFPEQDYALYLIDQLLIEQRKTLAQYSLPTPIHDWQHDRLNPLIGFELNYDSAIEQHQRDEAYEKMNEGQRHCFNIIIAAVEQNLMSAHFFLQDYASTGKIFLYNVICNHFRIKKEIIICVALSGIAVLLFPGGSISHSRFCILLNFI
jgi:PIF1-like helicase